MILTGIADVRKGQTDMPYLGEHQNSLNKVGDTKYITCI